MHGERHQSDSDAAAAVCEQRTRETCVRARYRTIYSRHDIVRSTNLRSISRYPVIDMITRQNPIQRTVSLFICVCIALCTIVAHNIAQNRPDSFPPYPPDDHHSSDDVYLREGGDLRPSGQPTNATCALNAEHLDKLQNIVSPSSTICYQSYGSTIECSPSAEQCTAVHSGSWYT